MNIKLSETAKERIIQHNQNGIPVKVKITGYS